MKKRSESCLIALLTCFALSTPLVAAQDYSQAEDELFTPAELDSILAPIALYPDSVLSHILIASTYPLEVIQAARWSSDHPELEGELAVAAVEDFDWDPSVKALTAFPELLARMDEDIEWTQQIGDAFLIQESSVVAAVQGLRDRAYSQGHLRTNEHVRVVREERVIYIEPARTRYVYLPYYDPQVVYGRWWWDAYPPYRWRHPRFRAGISFYWGSGFRVAPTFYFSSFHWSQKRVVVVNHHHYPRRHFRSGREVARYHRAAHWRHDPHHRRGVNYRHRVQEHRLIEHRAQPTRRANARQRSVADQRRWASSRRNGLDLQATKRSQDRATAQGSRSARSGADPRRAQRREIGNGSSRSTRQVTQQSLRGSVSRASQRSAQPSSTRSSSRSERTATRRSRASGDRSASVERSISRSTNARVQHREGPVRSAGSGGIRVPRSLDSAGAVQRSTPAQRVSGTSSGNRTPSVLSRQPRATPRHEQRRAPVQRRQSAPARAARQAPPRSSGNSRARVQSRSRSTRGEHQRRN